MIRRCLETNAVFGIVLIRHGVEAMGPLADPYPIGCTARIIEIEPLGNGRMNLTAIGEERFEIYKSVMIIHICLGRYANTPYNNPIRLKSCALATALGNG